MNICWDRTWWGAWDISLDTQGHSLVPQWVSVHYIEKYSLQSLKIITKIYEMEKVTNVTTCIWNHAIFSKLLLKTRFIWSKYQNKNMAFQNICLWSQMQLFFCIPHNISVCVRIVGHFLFEYILCVYIFIYSYGGYFSRVKLYISWPFDLGSHMSVVYKNYEYMSPGGYCWNNYPGTLLFSSGHWNLFVDQVNLLYPMYKWVSAIWLNDRVPS